MSNDIINIGDNASLINYIQKGKLELPFNNDIYLYTIELAGSKYYIRDVDIILHEDSEVFLKREPDNEHDEYAIEVFTRDNKKIGYMPRRNNRIFARLMDGGKVLFGKVKRVEYYFDEIREILIRIYMKDI